MKLPFKITDDMSIDQISAYIDQIKEHAREYQEDLRNEIKAILIKRDPKAPPNLIPKREV